LNWFCVLNLQELKNWFYVFDLQAALIFLNPFFIKFCGFLHVLNLLMNAVCLCQKTGNGLLVAFNPISGEVTDSGQLGSDLGFRPTAAAMIHQSNEESLHPIVLLSSDGRVECFPSSTINVVYEARDKLFFYVVDNKSGWVHGYGLQSSTPKVRETALIH
jgi:hypothetical protein